MAVMTAEEARRNGDATAEQRAELRELIARKCVTDEWRNRFFDDVLEDGGLMKSRASSALAYLRPLADRSEQPVYATAAQTDRIRELLRERLAPRKWVQPLVALLDAGRLPYVNADLMIADLERMVMRKYKVPERLPASVGEGLDDGYYAVVDTNGRVRKYRLVIRAGMREVWQITGELYRQRHQVRGVQARDVIAVISADPAGAAARYAKTTGRCTACNTKIGEQADNPGYQHGYGPDCWKKREALRLNRDAKAELADAHPQQDAA